MTIKQAQAAAKRFMKRTGYLVDWVEIRKAALSDNIIIRDVVKYIAIAKIKL